MLFIVQESLIASKLELENLAFNKQFLAQTRGNKKSVSIYKRRQVKDAVFLVRDELDSLFILNQDSAVIQILLDIYLLLEKVIYLTI